MKDSAVADAEDDEERRTKDDDDDERRCKRNRTEILPLLPSWGWKGLPLLLLHASLVCHAEGRRKRRKGVPPSFSSCSTGFAVPSSFAAALSRILRSLARSLHSAFYLKAGDLRTGSVWFYVGKKRKLERLHEQTGTGKRGNKNRMWWRKPWNGIRAGR